jgi:hypothetical protein
MNNLRKFWKNAFDVISTIFSSLGKISQLLNCNSDMDPNIYVCVFSQFCDVPKLMIVNKKIFKNLAIDQI